jgi:hypothetical protein
MNPERRHLYDKFGEEGTSESCAQGPVRGAALNYIIDVIRNTIYLSARGIAATLLAHTFMAAADYMWDACHLQWVALWK